MSTDPTTPDLSDATVALLHKAAQSRDAARAARKTAADKHNATQQAQLDETSSLKASEDAAHEALNDAQAAIAAVTADLNFDVPEPPAPPPAP